jgi:alpha-L-fucosidase
METTTVNNRRLNMKIANVWALACMALAFITAGTSMAADNTGSGGTITYTDSNGANPRPTTPYDPGYYGGGAGSAGGNGTMKRARPTRAQVSFHEMELGMFIHFMPTSWFTKGGIYGDLSRINPTELDTDQWVDVAMSMGAKYIVFVAKHAPGFRYWQTDVTPFGMKQLSWRNGRGDIVADLAASCSRRGVKLGLYLTAWDGYYGAGEGGIIGGSSLDAAMKLRGEKLEATPQAQANYTKIYRRELTEVLSRYGEICEIWFDGGVQLPVHDIIEKYAPNAMVFSAPCDQPIINPIRWCGNENGSVNYPLWNGRHPVRIPESNPNNPEYFGGDPAGQPWEPVESDTTLRYGPPGYPPKWAWEPGQENLVRTVDQLMEIYYSSVGRGAVLLLNHTPDPSGRIPEGDARRAAEFGAEIKRRFGHSLAETQGNGTVLELKLGKPARIDHVITMEDIAQGQRVAEYVLEGLKGNDWGKLAAGCTIGYKKIDRFDPVTVTAVRLRITKSLEVPVIRRMAVQGDAEK